MAHAAVLHDGAHFVQVGVRLAADHLAGHHVADADAGRQALLGHHPAQHVALGEHPLNLALVEDNYRADMMLVHDQGRIQHRGVRAHGDDMRSLPGQ